MTRRPTAPTKATDLQVRWRVPFAEGTGLFRLAVDVPGLPGWEAVVELEDDGSIATLAMQRATVQGNLAPGERPPLTARQMRSFPVGQLHQLALASRAEYASAVDELVAPTMTSDDFARSYGAFVAAGKRHPGARGHGDLWYARWAGRYAAIAVNSARPIQDLAGETGEPPEYVRNVIHECRNRGLLTPAAVHGRAGGELTPAALELLKGDDHGER